MRDRKDIKEPYSLIYRKLIRYKGFYTVRVTRMFDSDSFTGRLGPLQIIAALASYAVIIGSWYLCARCCVRCGFCRDEKEAPHPGSLRRSPALDDIRVNEPFARRRRRKRKFVMLDRDY